MASREISPGEGEREAAGGESVIDVDVWELGASGNVYIYLVIHGPLPALYIFSRALGWEILLGCANC